MFRVLISNQFGNADQIANHKVGLIKTNFIDQSLTCEDRGASYSYNIHRSVSSIQAQIGKTIKAGPIIVDVSMFDATTHQGRESIFELISTIHKLTKYSFQIGYLNNTVAREIKLDQAWVDEVIDQGYKQDKYGKPELLKETQFVVCWTQPYTPDWSEWEQFIKLGQASCKRYQRPIYADISTIYHHISKTMGGKPIDPERIGWMIERIYLARFDGVFIHGPSLSQHGAEILVNTVNQINE